MTPPGTLILTRSEISALFSLDECITAVEQAFKLHAEGKSLPPGVLAVHARNGGFHIKAAGLELDRLYFAAKINGNFFLNTERFGMPNIQGVIVLCDGENGYPLAIMDSIEITIIRTGAATAVAARYLARPESKIATICGCGNQGRVQLRALARVLPLEQVYAFDTDTKRAARFADELSTELQIGVGVTDDLGKAVRRSDVLVTCTPSKEHFVNKDWISSGTFIAAVGADSQDKQELDPAILASSTVVVDILDQCASIGELHHAIEMGLVTREKVHAELGDIVSSRKPGRVSEQVTIVFDSTGTALQDTAAAVTVYKKALMTGKGNFVNLLDR